MNINLNLSGLFLVLNTLNNKNQKFKRLYCSIHFSNIKKDKQSYNSLLTWCRRLCRNVYFKLRWAIWPALCFIFERDGNISRWLCVGFPLWCDLLHWTWRDWATACKANAPSIGMQSIYRTSSNGCIMYHHVIICATSATYKCLCLDEHAWTSCPITIWEAHFRENSFQLHTYAREICATKSHRLHHKDHFTDYVYDVLKF